MAKTQKQTNKLPTKENPGPEVSQGKFYQMFKEDLAPNPLQALPKIKEEGTFLSLFYEANITLKPKPAKDITRKTHKLSA